MVVRVMASVMTADVQQWLRAARRIRVLNCFDHAWNLADEKNRVISVVTPSVGSGPLNIVVPVRALPSIAAYERLYNQPNCLSTPRMTIFTDAAQVWDATLPQPDKNQFVDFIRLGKQMLQHSPESLAQPYLGLEPAADFHSRVLHELAAAAQALVRILAVDDDAALGEAVVTLAGKGAGLTPSGDDWLLGCMAALWCVAQPQKAEIIAREAAPCTTVFSAAQLVVAGKRQFAQPWHLLMQATRPDPIRAAMRQLLRYGSTSGADALTGFVQGLEAMMAGVQRSRLD